MAILAETPFVQAMLKAYKPWFDEWKTKDPKNQAIKHTALCYQIYKHAATNRLKALVAGRIPNTTDWVGLPGIDDLVKANFKVTNESKTGDGSVLNSSCWTPVANDAWVMGGIHANLPFYLASPRKTETFKHSRFKLTVTAREFVGLTTFGYTLVGGHPTLGEVFQCTDKAKANAATFENYIKAWDAALKADGATITKMINLPVGPA